MLDSDAELELLLGEFLHECSEGLDALDRDLTVLEGDPTNIEARSGVFRTFHTIHGTSGFFGFEKLVSLARAAERLSRGLRAGGSEWSAGPGVALRETAVMLRRILSSIAAERSEGDADCAALVERLGQLARPHPDRRSERLENP